MRVLEHAETPAGPDAGPAVDDDITAPIELPKQLPAERAAGRLAHVPALDGVRGLAMVLVVLSHLWIVMPEGFLDRLGPAAGLFHSGSHGVTLFLVIGGFLVTSSLLSEHERSGRISVGRFWRRRLARLAGPLLVVLASCGFVWWAESFASSSPRATIDSLLAGSTFTSNWLFIDRPLAARTELGHLWYLGVEQQFYVGWVLLVALLGRRRWALAMLAAVGAVAVVMWRLVVWEQWGWWVASARTDTRMDGLLIGSLLGIVLATGRLPNRRWVAPIGLVAIAGLVVLTGGDEYAYLGTIGVLFLPDRRCCSPG